MKNTIAMSAMLIMLDEVVSIPDIAEEVEDGIDELARAVVCIDMLDILASIARDLECCLNDCETPQGVVDVSALVHGESHDVLAGKTSYL